MGTAVLPCIPSLENGIGGLDTLITEYKKMMMSGQGLLTNAGEVMMENLCALLKRLEKLEKEAFAQLEVLPSLESEKTGGERLGVCVCERERERERERESCFAPLAE
jgi:5'-3' exonuclease